MNGNMTQDDLEQILADHPTLCDFGFGTYHPRSLRQSKAAFAEQLEGARAALRSHLDQVNVCLRWLKDVERLKLVNEKRTSYGLKHCVERNAGVYVTNGAFIVAAIFAGFKMKKCEPNAFFNVAEKTIRERRHIDQRTVATDARRA